MAIIGVRPPHLGKVDDAFVASGEKIERLYCYRWAADLG
jgi:hypothetical protein